jgi:prepilin-type N-terminal cleavage/methylation domain-containing protein
MFLRFSSRAFTLIELLLVISIIGVLAAIVFASLSTARIKAQTAKVQGQLNEMRSAAEIYYASNGNYGSATTVGCTAPTPAGMFANTSSGMLAIATSTYILAQGALDCGSTGTAWSAAAALPGGGYFCVDSTGAARSAASSSASTPNASYANLIGGSNYAHSTAGSSVCA